MHFRTEAWIQQAAFIDNWFILQHTIKFTRFVIKVWHISMRAMASVCQSTYGQEYAELLYSAYASIASMIYELI